MYGHLVWKMSVYYDYLIINCSFNFFFCEKRYLICSWKHVTKRWFLILESKFPHHNVEYLHEHFDEPESHIGGYGNSGSIIFIWINNNYYNFRIDLCVKLELISAEYNLFK